MMLSNTGISRQAADISLQQLAIPGYWDTFLADKSRTLSDGAVSNYPLNFLQM